MRKLLTILFFILIFGEINAQSILKLKFYDNCIDSVVDLEYDISRLDGNLDYFSVKDSIIIKNDGTYIIYVYRHHGDYHSSYDFSKELFTTENYYDTIELPKISVWFSSALHSQYMKFHYCNTICNGNLIDYYKTGQKWIEGEFEDGIPKRRINYYDRKGNLIRVEIYNKKGLRRIKYPNYRAYLNNN